MAFAPVIGVTDLSDGSDLTGSTVLVKLRPFGNVSGEINCTRLGTSNKYLADSDVDETKAYHIMVDIGAGYVKRGMVFDDNVGTDKSSVLEAF